MMPEQYVNSTRRKNGTSQTVTRRRRERYSDENPLEQLIEANADGMIVVDREGTIRFSNRAAEKLFGVATGELLGRLLESVAQASQAMEFDIITDSGEQRVAEFKAAPVLWGGARCRLLSLREVTARRRIDESMRCEQRHLREVIARQSREREDIVDELHRQIDYRNQAEYTLRETADNYRLAFDRGSIGRAIVDVNGRIIQVNPALARMLGCTQQELLKTSFDELASGDEAVCELELNLQLVDGAISEYSVEKRLRIDTGGEIETRVTSYALPRSQNQSLRILKLVEDVSEQHRIQELARRQERLAAIGTLVAGIAHEINNPAAAALLSAETALVFLDTPNSLDEIRKCLKNIVASAERCGRITHDTLRFAGSSEGRKLPSCINRIVRKSRDLARIAAEHAPSRIELELDESIPQLCVNELEWELAVVNLITNAVQANSQPTHVVVQTRLRGDNHVEICVADDGPGMTSEEVGQACEPFYTTRKSVGGTGLGLSIVQRIVEDHGGTMKLESELERGTIVRMTIPIAFPENTTDAARSIA